MTITAYGFTLDQRKCQIDSKAIKISIYGNENKQIFFPTITKFVFFTSFAPDLPKWRRIHRESIVLLLLLRNPYCLARPMWVFLTFTGYDLRPQKFLSLLTRFFVSFVKENCLLFSFVSVTDWNAEMTVLLGFTPSLSVKSCFQVLWVL